MKENMKDQELEYVVGGTEEEINKIISLFRKYGYEAQAKKLERSGSIFFGDALSSVLDEMGFPHKITVYADYEKQNLYSMDGGFAGHLKTVDTIDDYLYHLKNNIPY